MIREAASEHVRDPEQFRAEVMARGEPVVLRGIARDWPMLAGGTVAAAGAELERFDAGRSAEVFVGAPSIGARYHYDDTLAGFNFERRTMPFRDALSAILTTAGQDDRPSLYMGSLTAETFFPGIEDSVRLPFVPATVRPRLWIARRNGLPGRQVRPERNARHGIHLRGPQLRDDRACGADR